MSVVKPTCRSFLNKGNVLYEMDDDAGYQHLVFIIEGGAAV